ncbi:MAG: PQQ-binding-like beta-propeller repeat protein [Verrucomicrobia bacterium]|nr:PQQ-binding-like beta-propeller repeat protein [Verrucomicrobiota bacterium]
MKTLISHLLVATLAAFGHAAPTPDPEPVPFTAKELAQGFRERVILARPHASRRATADAEEARDGIRVREKFLRFRELRIIELDQSDNADRAIARLRATGRYEFVEPDYIRHLAVEPNDPRFTDGSLWALKNTGLNNGIPGSDIQATAAWDIIREAPNVIVAVVDSGVNLTHLDLAANLWTNPAPTFGDVNGARFLNGIQSGNPADDNGHGTHVAGTIGAIGDNNLGVTGVAWRVQIMAIKVFPASGRGTVSDIARGINYAVAHGAHIINASYGETGSTGFSLAEFAAITAARDAGVIFVAAAGNAAANMDVSRFYPASHALDNIVTVGASGRRDEAALFSNYGSAVDLFAPGSEIVSLTYTSNTATATRSGTSMAAPHVTGALALLKARFPSDNYRQLINRILRSSEPGGSLAGKSQTNGRLNVLNALLTANDPDGNRPFNDRFADRPHLTGANLALRASNTGATAEPGEPAHAGGTPGASIWWEWTAPASGTVSVNTTGSTYDTVLAVYTSPGPSAPAAPGGLTAVAANDDNAGATSSRLSFTAQSGVTYQIAVDGKPGQTGLTLLNLGTTPANDLFASPVTLAGQSLHVTGTNANGSREAGEPRILGFPGGASLWYRWTAPRSGRFQVAAVSSDFDPLLAIFTAPAPAAPVPGFSDGLTKVAESDNAGAGTASLCTFDAAAGTTYSIVVDTKFAGAVGQFTLSLTDSRWQATTGSNITGAPAVGRDGTLYVGSTDNSIYAYAPDGSPRWSYPTNGIIDTCSPAIADDGTVYVGSNDGRFYAFTASGTLKWTRNFGLTAPVSNSPALAANGTIYVKPRDGFLYALNPANGAIVWRRDVHAPETYASPSVAPDGTIYQGSEDKNLYAINPDGTLKWTFAGENEIYAVPAIDAAGNIYFTVLNSGKLYCVSPAGTLRWTYAGASLGSSSSPALSADGSTAYFAGYDARLHAVNTASGAARWVFPLDAEVRASSPAVDANGVIYIGCYDFRLYAINADGTLKRTWDTGDWIRSSPAISGTTLYVGSNDNKLYAFDIGAGAATGPWPQYRHNVRRLGRAIAEPLAIAVAPQAQIAVAGERVELRVVATGAGPFRYQWFNDGTPVAGATSAVLALPAVSSAQAGNYAVTITDAQGSLTSPLAPVAVLAPGEKVTPARLANFSVRMTAGAGAQTFILGFYVAGSPAKPVLIRAIGPALVQFGVSGVLDNPQLQLFSAGAVLAANDDWASSASGDGVAATANAFTAAGAFPLDPAAKDAALVPVLNTGSYTVQITPSTSSAQAPAAGFGQTASTGSGLAAAGGPGVALAELYDTAPSGGARLANFSARGQVGTGGDVLIGGFTISGNVPKTVVIRAIGPALTAFGVAGALTDPKLALYRGIAQLGENDNWGGASELVSAFSQVGAFALGSGASRDAALVVTLAPGSYTAQVSGVNSTTGVGLVEVFEVP